MWTAYEPLLSFSTRLTVPPGYLASATALALLAAVPVMIVPDRGCQFCGTCPTTRWFGADGANGAALALPDAPLLEVELTIA